LGRCARCRSRCRAGRATLTSKPSGSPSWSVSGSVGSVPAMICGGIVQSVVVVSALVGFVPAACSCRFVRPSRSGSPAGPCFGSTLPLSSGFKPPRTSNPSLSRRCRCPGRRTAFPQGALLVAQAVAVRVDVGVRSEEQRAGERRWLAAAFHPPRTIRGRRDRACWHHRVLRRRPG